MKRHRTANEQGREDAPTPGGGTPPVTPPELRDQLRDIVAFADALISCPDERSLFRQAVEFARRRLGLIRCAIWVRDGERMRGTFGTDQQGLTTDEYGYSQPVDEVWRRIFATAENDPHWQLYPDAQLHEWNGRETVPFRRGWLAATPILKRDERVAVLTNDAAGTSTPCQPDQQQVVEVYGALLSHVLTRREVEERVRTSAHFARATLDALAESVCVVNSDGHIVAVNEAWRSFARQNQADPQICGEGANYLAACDQASRQGDEWARLFLEGFAAVRDGRRGDFMLEYPCHTPQCRRWFTARVRRFGQNGQAHFTIAHTDVTSLKEAEGTLADRVSYYESLIHKSLDIIAVLDAQGRFLFVNEAVRGSLGYTPGELAQRTVFEFLHPADQSLAADEIERTLRGGLDDNLLVFRFRGADGSWHELEARGNALAGDPPRLLINARDVSERVRSEHLRASVRRISDVALTTSTPDELYAALHRIVDDLMPARNFYIALHDPAGDLLSFPYWRDEFDPVSPPKKPGRGLTELVLKQGHALLITAPELAQLAADGEAHVQGHPPVTWLGAPLRAGQDILGVVAVQTYNATESLGPRDRLALETMAGPMAAALVSKRHEAARAASERSYQALFTEMPGAFVHLEVLQGEGGRAADARILQANSALESITGLSTDRCVGTCMSVCIPHHPRPWFEMCVRVAASGQPERMEFYSDLLHRHLLFIAYCPHPGHCALIIEDVTATHTTRQELQRRDAILEATAYAAERFLGSPNWESCVQDVLRALGEAADVSRVYICPAAPAPDEPQPGHPRYVWVGTDVPPVRFPPEAAASGGFAHWLERLRQGQSVSGAIADFPEDQRALLQEHGIKSLLIVPIFVHGVWWGYFGFDDCRRARAWTPQEEGALRSAAQILAEAVQRKTAEEQTALLRTALASAANGIVITDRAGAIVFVNEAVERLTGYTGQEIMGRKPSVLRSGSHDDQFYGDLWRTVLAGQVWRGEITNRRKDGTQYLEDMTITPVRDGAGQVTHFIAIKQDITEQRNLQQQLLQAQKMESVGRLAGGIAHDFNNLLQAITGFSSILLGELGTGDPRRADVEEIDRAAQRAVSLTRQLLAFSRKQKMELAPTNLKTVLQSTDKMLRRLIGEDVKLVTRTTPDLPLVRADAGQLEQIIVNLAVNARDAMPQGGQLTLDARTVTLEADALPAVAESRAGRFVLMEIRDTGTGMTPRVRERLFEPFFSTKGAGRGTGLGLAVVYGIVRQHEGFIDVETAPGQGTAFFIYLPVYGAGKGEAVTIPEPAPAPPVDERFLEGRGEHLLVVEDEQGVRDFATRVLTGHGYRIQVAPSVTDARRLFNTAGQKFDLLFTDVVLPDGNGVHLADELRAQDPALRVVLTSAYSEEQSRWAQIQVRGYHFISKPYALASLLRLLRDALTAKR